MNPCRAEDLVNVLHMSDFHYDSTRKGTDAKEHGDMLDACVKYLEQNKDELKIKVVVLTGDIASSGSLADYEAFHAKFLQKVLDIFGLGLGSVLICPGNHDVSRGEITPEEDIITRSKNNVSPHTIKAAYSGVFNGLISYMRKYKYPCYRNGIDPSKDMARDYLTYLYGYRQVEGLNFICLNSSWNCRNEKDERFEHDYGKLFLGREFVADALNQAPERHSDGDPEPVIIAITHHPFFYDSSKPQEVLLSDKTDLFISNEYQWLDKSEVMDIPGEDGANTFRTIHQIERKVCVVLAGHLHKAVGPLVVGARGTSGYIGGSLDSDVHDECSFQVLSIHRNTGEIKGHVHGCKKDKYPYVFSEGDDLGSPNLHEAVSVVNMITLNLLSEHSQKMEQQIENPQQEPIQRENQGITPLRITIKDRAKSDANKAKKRHLL